MQQSGTLKLIERWKQFPLCKIAEGAEHHQITAGFFTISHRFRISLIPGRTNTVISATLFAASFGSNFIKIMTVSAGHSKASLALMIGLLPYLTDKHAIIAKISTKAHQL
jgi:hypothetical protein